MPSGGVQRSWYRLLVQQLAATGGNRISSGARRSWCWRLLQKRSPCHKEQIGIDSHTSAIERNRVYSGMPPASPTRRPHPSRSVPRPPRGFHAINYSAVNLVTTWSPPKLSAGGENFSGMYLAGHKMPPKRNQTGEFCVPGFSKSSMFWCCSEHCYWTLTRTVMATWLSKQEVSDLWIWHTLMRTCLTSLQRGPNIYAWLFVDINNETLLYETFGFILTYNNCFTSIHVRISWRLLSPHVNPYMVIDPRDVPERRTTGRELPTRQNKVRDEYASRREVDEEWGDIVKWIKRTLSHPSGGMDATLVASNATCQFQGTHRDSEKGGGGTCRRGSDGERALRKPTLVHGRRRRHRAPASRGKANRGEEGGVEERDGYINGYTNDNTLQSPEPGGHVFLLPYTD
ncbi:hypothetical protein R3P38DRAFT_2793727 [Favolaschia claudopus]|uniref:Uncharacterized protein n=1 Tax=Favolaschia claudopus TaxID=2862362 RepID=A0AAW0ACK6_9AGAR